MIGYYDYTVWLTYGSLVSSMIGLMLGFSGHPVHASFCLLACAVLDAFDGKLARTKKNRTEAEKRYGIQIDSFSDLIAFGLLPCAVGYGLFFAEAQPVWVTAVYGIASCLLALAALIRLANFNVEEELRQEQTASNRDLYTGMPVIITAGIVPLLVVLISTFEMGILGFAFFTVAMLAMGFLFLLKKLRVSKPAGKSLIGLFLAGLVEVILLVGCL